MEAHSVEACAVVVGNDEDGWNVEYSDDSGKKILRAGCMDKVDAEELAQCLNNTSWLDVDADGRL